MRLLSIRALAVTCTAAALSVSLTTPASSAPAGTAVKGAVNFDTGLEWATFTGASAASVSGKWLLDMRTSSTSATPNAILVRFLSGVPSPSNAGIAADKAIPPSKGTTLGDRDIVVADAQGNTFVGYHRSDNGGLRLKKFRADHGDAFDLLLVTAFDWEALLPDEAGGVYVLGRKASTGVNQGQAVTRHLGANGELLWEQLQPIEAVPWVQGSRAMHLARSPQGFYEVYGYGSDVNNRLRVVHRKADGTILWTNNGLGLPAHVRGFAAGPGVPMDGNRLFVAYDGLPVVRFVAGGHTYLTKLDATGKQVGAIEDATNWSDATPSSWVEWHTAPGKLVLSTLTLAGTTFSKTSQDVALDADIGALKSFAAVGASYLLVSELGGKPVATVIGADRKVAAKQAWTQACSPSSVIASSSRFYGTGTVNGHVCVFGGSVTFPGTINPTAVAPIRSIPLRQP
jgi:hypothetical protein